MRPALVVFQYFLVQFAPATKGNGKKRMNHCQQPPTVEMQSCGELLSCSGVQWVSSVTRAHWQDAQAQEPVACCLLPLLQLMLHFEVASAANQFRFHLQFYSRLLSGDEARRQRGSESGGQRFGGIFGNQSLDVIIGHINSALALSPVAYIEI